MTFGLPPVGLVADFRASAMGIKPNSPGSLAIVSFLPRYPNFVNLVAVTFFTCHLFHLALDPRRL